MFLFIADNCVNFNIFLFPFVNTVERTIQPGTYEFTFQSHLPLGLPTSIEGAHGHIRYSASVVLDRPMWPDQKFEEDFTVIKPYNLNQQLDLRVKYY